jgi:ubiquinol-cytochrome c reductase cytochrome c subunit
MKRMKILVGAFLMAPVMSVAAANGSWLKAVPQADRVRVNSYSGSGDAAAGGNLFRNNCAKCHGATADGRGSRPSLKSDRVRQATDGELAWLIKNGEAFKGMPGWGALPEPERWQIITYLRSLNAPVDGGKR